MHASSVNCYLYLLVFLQEFTILIIIICPQPPNAKLSKRKSSMLLHSFPATVVACICLPHTHTHTHRMLPFCLLRWWVVGFHPHRSLAASGEWWHCYYSHLHFSLYNQLISFFLPLLGSRSLLTAHHNGMNLLEPTPTGGRAGPVCLCYWGSQVQWNLICVPAP